MPLRLKGSITIAAFASLAMALACGAAFLFRGRPEVKVETARAHMYQLAADFYLAKEKTGKTLTEINKNNCSECPCKGGRQLKGLSNSDQCAGNWNKALFRIYKTIHGRSAIPENFLRDPWGSPYLIHEKEGEQGYPPCTEDTITSAGPDGIQDTPDDLIQKIPNNLCR